MKFMLFAPWRYYDAAELFMDRALHALGHETIRVRQLHIDQLEELAVDATIVYQGLERRFVNSGDVMFIKGVKCVYLMDSYTRFKEKRSDQAIEFEKEWDIIFHAHHSPLEQEDSRVKFLPVAFDPQTHYWDGGEEEENVDVCFIGTGHPSRKWMLGEKMMIYGNDWDSAMYRPIYGEEKRKELKHIKININQHFPGDTVNMRQFEIPAMRRFMLTDSPWPFVENKEVATYDGTPADFRKQVGYWLEQPEERKRVAAAGYKAVQAHSYLERAKEVVRIIESVSK